MLRTQARTRHSVQRPQARNQLAAASHLNLRSGPKLDAIGIEKFGIMRPTLRDVLAKLDTNGEGRQSYSLIEKLYPICRSITGDGVRQSLRLLQDTVRMEVREVPTGTHVFDWTGPNEWNICDGYIKYSAGRRVVDFQRCNLHVLNYSAPVRQKMSLAELRPHLFTLPDKPDWIPYRTSYYRETWGFCLSHREFEQLEEGTYE